MTDGKIREIARLNDDLRKHGVGGDILLTTSVDQSPHRDEIVRAIRQYDFPVTDDGNDPYCEHDFAVVEVRGSKYYGKIDYYDLALQYHSPDKFNPRVTRRVLTILKAADY